MGLLVLNQVRLVLKMLVILLMLILLVLMPVWYFPLVGGGNPSNRHYHFPKKYQEEHLMAQFGFTQTPTNLIVNGLKLNRHKIANILVM